MLLLCLFFSSHGCFVVKLMIGKIQLKFRGAGEEKKFVVIKRKPPKTQFMMETFQESVLLAEFFVSRLKESRMPSAKRFNEVPLQNLTRE